MAKVVRERFTSPDLENLAQQEMFLFQEAGKGFHKVVHIHKKTPKNSISPKRYIDVIYHIQAYETKSNFVKIITYDVIMTTTDDWQIECSRTISRLLELIDKVYHENMDIVWARLTP